MAGNSMGNKYVFHGDVENFPHETWESYEIKLHTARMAAGANEVSDEIKKGQMLIGLRGRAETFLFSNPELLTKTYDEVRKIFRDKYTGISSRRQLMNLHQIVQGQGESVSDFLSRLRVATSALVDRKPLMEILENYDDNVERTPEMRQYAQQVSKVLRETFDVLLYHHFLRGLDDKIRQALGISQPENMYEAQTLAERQEQFMQLYGSASGN